MTGPWERPARAWLWALALLGVAASPATAAPVVLAAASLQDAMGAAADAWAARGHPRPVVSFAASSALARQVQAGAPADLFASADEQWMDAIQSRGLLAPGSRADFVGNRLVVVVPARDPVRLGTLRGSTLASVLSRGPLAMADPSAVPAGIYGKMALEHLGAWTAVAPHVVRADSVRSALALVERGAAPFGIVYATDAAASPAVRIAGMFPVSSHAPIRYPVARLARAADPDAEGFRRFLLSAPGRAIFRRFGFTTP
jgi:molybdate transport system substrate-binding protein